MLYNIKHIHLHCVFHGIRFKVNKDWVSGIDTLLFLYTWCIFRIFIHKKIFRSLVFLTPSLYFCKVMSIVRPVNFKSQTKNYEHQTSLDHHELPAVCRVGFLPDFYGKLSGHIWSMSTLPSTSASSMPCKASCHSSCQPLWVS